MAPLFLDGASISGCCRYCWFADMFLTQDDLTQVSLPQLAAAANWQAQYRLITQWGKLVAAKPQIRLAANVIKGCELPVWLAHQLEAGRHQFAFDSDSRVINGLAVLLLAQVNGKSAADVAGLDLEAELRQLGLDKHLTPSRNNGFKAIIARIHQLLAEV